MKLYTFPPAPNPTKVEVYLGEKGISLERVLVNLPKGEQNEPAFRAIAPLGALPVLELDDGTRLTESLAIIELFEELHPEPPMWGRTPLARARAREIERLIDTRILGGLGQIVHGTRSPLPGVLPAPEVVARARARMPRAWEQVEQRLADGPFVAGDSPTVGDCTLYAALRFGAFFGETPPDECVHIAGWWERFRERPSAI